MKCNLIKRLSLSLIWICAALFGSSQTDNDNHQKYWYYKSRLNNDFVKVGLGQGESIPLQTRGKDVNTQNFTDPRIKLDWGDATSYLGYYIAILATEYKLLIANNQDAKATKHELFCAINAINRLDYTAETYFINGQPNLNGYFIRDDIPSDFVQNNYEHFNYFNKSNNVFINPQNINPQDGHPFGNSDARGFASKFQGGAFKVSSSLESWKTFTSGPYYLSGNGPPAWAPGTHTIGPIPEMSQDQAISILYGLAFVKKFVPNQETDNGAIFGYGSGETSLAAEAEKITDRIVNHIRASKDQSGNSCLANVSTGWHIKNPVNCNSVGYNHDPSHHGWGDDAEPFSYPFAEAGYVIKYGDFSGGIGNLSLTQNYPKRGSQLYYNTPYHNLFSSNLGDDLWHGLATVVVPGNGDNRLHVSNLASICNCVYGSVLDKYEQWVESIYENIPWLNWIGIVIKWVWTLVDTIIHTFLSVPGYYFNNTSTAINLNSYFGATDFDHAPLSRKVLHGGLYLQNTDYSFKYLLDVAPCDDIYYLPNESNQYGHVQWSASDRIEHPSQRRGGIGANDDAPGAGEFPGLDYLLYHNLWYIHELQGNNNPNIEDLSNIYVNKNGGYAPTNTIYRAYETITTENTLFNPNNNLGYMRAGKTIYFGVGTEIKTGATNGGLHAYIEKYNCATDNGAFRMMSGDTAQVSEVLDTKPHYVSYPQDEITTTEIITDKHFDDLITELPIDAEDAIEQAMTDAYPNYSKELFIKPTVTYDVVKAYFTMEKDELAFINILSLDGKNLYSNNYVGRDRSGIAIDLSMFPAGAYFLKFTTTKGTSKTQKIIKQ